MTKEKTELKAEERDLQTKLKALRDSGRIPAVLYGHKVKNQNLSVDAREFEKVFKKAGESTVVNLETGGKSHSVLIHDIQYHFLTSKPIHIDFYEVSMTEKLKAKVTLNFVGEAPAVKTSGGVLVKILNELEVECLAADLPHSLEVSLDALKTLTDTIHVKDVKVPAKVKVVNNPEDLIIKVQPPRDVEAELAKGVADEKAVVEAVVAASEKPKAETDEAAEGAKATQPAKEDKKE